MLRQDFVLAGRGRFERADFLGLRSRSDSAQAVTFRASNPSNLAGRAPGSPPPPNPPRRPPPAWRFPGAGCGTWLLRAGSSPARWPAPPPPRRRIHARSPIELATLSALSWNMHSIQGKKKRVVGEHEAAPAPHSQSREVHSKPGGTSVLASRGQASERLASTPHPPGCMGFLGCPGGGKGRGRSCATGQNAAPGQNRPWPVGYVPKKV